MSVIKLIEKHYGEVVSRSRRVWPKYSTQLMNLAGQNIKATAPKNVGSVKEAWLTMRSQNIRGTLQNWTNFYNATYGEDKLITAGNKIYTMLINMGIQWISEDMCIDFAKEVVYNKTHMGLGGEEITIEVVAKYFNLPYRFSTPEEESRNIDGWIGDKPVQVKPHDSVFKAHVHNHADQDMTLYLTYEVKNKKYNFYIHNPEFMSK